MKSKIFNFRDSNVHLKEVNNKNLFYLTIFYTSNNKHNIIMILLNINGHHELKHEYKTENV